MKCASTRNHISLGMPKLLLVFTPCRVRISSCYPQKSNTPTNTVDSCAQQQQRTPALSGGCSRSAVPERATAASTLCNALTAPTHGAMRRAGALRVGLGHTSEVKEEAQLRCASLPSTTPTYLPQQ